MSKESKPAADTPAPKKGKGKLMLVLVASLVLSLGGGGAAYWFMSRSDAPKKAAKGGDDGHGAGGHEDAGHDPAVVALPTFTVNLADPGASRYLRTTLALVIRDTEQAAALLAGDGHSKSGGENVRLAMARSAVLELLTTKTVDELTTAEGKLGLKTEIAERTSKALRLKVSDVLFSEFVVQ